VFFFFFFFAAQSAGAKMLFGLASLTAHYTHDPGGKEGLQPFQTVFDEILPGRGGCKWEFVYLRF
jgi:hypothetical protein